LAAPLLWRAAAPVTTTASLHREKIADDHRSDDCCK